MKLTIATDTEKLNSASATTYYRRGAAADFQAETFPRGSCQYEFWRGVARKCNKIGYAIERTYIAQVERETGRTYYQGW